jgi:hypothetical protein
VAASLLGSGRVLCPIFTGTSGHVLVGLSLSGGLDGTWAAEELVFRVYEPPRLSSIAPGFGDANGGTEVTIVGHGFERLAPAMSMYERRERALRCAFGSTVQSILPSFHNDTVVICVCAPPFPSTFVPVCAEGTGFESRIQRKRRGVKRVCEASP